MRSLHPLRFRAPVTACASPSPTTPDTPTFSKPSSLVPRQKTRLQQEADQALAIDVEYAHVLLLDGSRHRLQLPVEVCIVDAHRRPLVHTLINGFDVHGIEDHSQIEWEFKGGVRVEEGWLEALALAALRPRLLSLLGDPSRLVVGHNVGKDLLALGIDEKIVPLARRRDTMRYKALQGPKGFGKSLVELAATKLGRKIQAQSRHDPCEDAVAALDLYLMFCHYDRALMSYDDLVESYSQDIIVDANS